MIRKLSPHVTKRADPLYIFAHLQKTAGSTFRKHVRAAFAPEELLEIYLGGELKNQEAIERYMHSLTPERKAKTKMILGHHVYFGIHRLFPKEPRYIIFLRNPVDRTISHYNYCRTDHARGQQNHHPPVVGEDGDILPFRIWFDRNPRLHNFMTRYLVRFYRGTISDGEVVEADLQTAREVLGGFYFVGVTERYSEDVLYLYHELGLRKFFGDENISEKHFEADEAAIDLIRINCRYDLELYEFARELNARFRSQHKDFQQVVTGMKQKIGVDGPKRAAIE
jgi:hypothetical protein